MVLDVVVKQVSFSATFIVNELLHPVLHFSWFDGGTPTSLPSCSLLLVVELNMTPSLQAVDLQFFANKISLCNTMSCGRRPLPALHRSAP